MIIIIIYNIILIIYLELIIIPSFNFYRKYLELSKPIIVDNEDEYKINKLI